MTGVAGVFAAMQIVILHGLCHPFKLTALLGHRINPGAYGRFPDRGRRNLAGMAFGYEWREMAVFSVLALVLIFRPGGLLGTLRNAPADERI
jgi:hypothetical protein